MCGWTANILAHNVNLEWNRYTEGKNLAGLDKIWSQILIHW